MFEFWLADENIVFAGGFFLLIGLALLQIIGIGDFGTDFDGDVDGNDPGLTNIGDGLLSFLGIGRLPLMIWLALLVMLFTLIGFTGQYFSQSLTGMLLSPWLASALAALLAVPGVSLISRPLARIIPGDETTAVSLDSLIGRFAFVEIGTARSGFPARAKVLDLHGLPHFVMVEPDNDGQILEAGEKLLLVRREGKLFRAISHGSHHLPRLEDNAI